MTHPKIYKLDSSGKLREWWVEGKDRAYRTISGLEGGQAVASEWTTVTGKSGRSDIVQTEQEIQSEYTKKLSREYTRDRDKALSGVKNFFKPMLAHKYADYKDKLVFPMSCQPKLDGIRCIASKAGLNSREGKPIVGVPHIQEALVPFFKMHPTAVLDGELYNHDLHDDFNAIVSCVKKQKPSAADLDKSRKLVQYHVYDWPDTNDFSLRVIGLSRELEGSRFIVLVKTIEAKTQAVLDAAYEAFLEAGYEGQMVRLDAPYEQKRSKHLLKRKEFLDGEFDIVRIEEGKGNWSGVAKSVTCKLPDGREFGSGIRGTHEQMAYLLLEKPKRATIRYFCLTPDGIPRFGVATAFHETDSRL